MIELVAEGRRTVKPSNLTRSHEYDAFVVLQYLTTVVRFSFVFFVKVPELFKYFVKILIQATAQ